MLKVRHIVNSYLTVAQIIRRHHSTIRSSPGTSDAHHIRRSKKRIPTFREFVRLLQAPVSSSKTPKFGTPNCSGPGVHRDVPIPPSRGHAQSSDFPQCSRNPPPLNPISRSCPGCPSYLNGNVPVRVRRAIDRLVPRPQIIPPGTPRFDSTYTFPDHASASAPASTINASDSLHSYRPPRPAKHKL